MDPVTGMNLVFDVVILLFAAYSFTKTRSSLLLWFTFAFCIFAASYALSILGLASSLFLIPLRAVGYLSIIAGIGIHYFQRR